MSAVLLKTIKKRIDFIKISKKGEKSFTKGFILQKYKRSLSHKDKENIGKETIRNAPTNPTPFAEWPELMPRSKK